MENIITYQEMIHLHGLFKEISEYVNANIEGSGYQELGVKPKHVHKNRADHKQASYLASKLIADEIDDVDPIENWDKDFEPDYPFESGNVRVKENTRTYIEYNGVEISIYYGEESKRLDVLDELSNGKNLLEAIGEHYSAPKKAFNRKPYHQLHREALDDGMLPEEDVEDVENVLQWFRG